MRARPYAVLKRQAVSESETVPRLPLNRLRAHRRATTTDFKRTDSPLTRGVWT